MGGADVFDELVHLGDVEEAGALRLTLGDILTLSRKSLARCGAIELQSEPVADSIAEAEAEGIRQVGLECLPTYCEHLRCGKINGSAEPGVVGEARALLRVDACHGFCHPAFMAGFSRFVDMARGAGIAALILERSYSAGVLGWFVDRIARQGMVGLAFANSAACVAPWGGRRAFLGTNPLAFSAPRIDGPPLVIDMATSVTARVNVMAAMAQGESVPEGWVVDRNGGPSTDPGVLLEGGTVAPLGGAKGFSLGLMVEVLAAGLSGGSWSRDASSFATKEGGPPNVGQLFIAIAPAHTAGGNLSGRVEDIYAHLDNEAGVRMPGSRRIARRHTAETIGVEVPDELLASIEVACS